MKDWPKISAAEWEVMGLLWEQGGLSTGEIVRQLENSRGWSGRTIRTLVARLAKKGAVACDSRQRPAIFRAGVTRDACVRTESRSFLQRLFKGAHSPFLINLIKEASLTREEIEELRRILKEKEK